MFVGVLFKPTVGWLEVFHQATETCPKSEKFNQSSKLEMYWEFQKVWSHVDDDDDAACKKARDPDEFVSKLPFDPL